MELLILRSNLKDGSKMTLEINDKQYFTPDIEDIRVGYECELLMNMNVDILKSTNLPPEYKPFVFEKWKMGIVDDVFGSIRTSYLTKEQIEAEGWIYTDINQYHKEDKYLRVLIGYVDDTIIDLRVSIFTHNGTLFYGECKSVNEFRYICKLLKIN